MARSIAGCAMFLVAAVAPLGEDALQPHGAGRAEHHGAVGIDVLAQADASRTVSEHLQQQSSAILPWLAAQITPSPSRITERIGSDRRAATIAGSWALQSCPPRENTRPRPPSRRQMKRLLF